MVTGQANRDHDHPDGYKIYPAMLKLGPQFIVPTGDTVYYDSDAPLATSIDLARFHWHRMYSFPTILKFHLSVPGYWEKDDHDSYHNDNWPGMSREYMGTFSWEQGAESLQRTGADERRAVPHLPLGQGGCKSGLSRGAIFVHPTTWKTAPAKAFGEKRKNAGSSKRCRQATRIGKCS